MRRDRKRILELLQYKGVVEIKEINAANDAFSKADTSGDYTLYLANSKKAAKAVKLLDKISPRQKPKPAFLYGRKAVSVQEIESVSAGASGLIRAADRALELRDEVNRNKASVLRCEAQAAALKAWEALPVSEAFQGTAHTAAYIGSLPGEYSAEDVLNLIGGDTSRLYAEAIYTAPGQTNLFIIAPRDLELNMRLQSIGFTRPAAPDQDKTPGERKRDLERGREALLASIAAHEGELAALAGLTGDIEFAEDYYAMRAEKYRAISRLAQSEHTFIMEGFILERDAPALKSELHERFACFFETVDIDEAEAPVYLEGGKYAMALTGILESYGMPGPGEFDPLPVMSVFYYLLYGLMFSDAGYGLIMAGICGFCLRRFTNMNENWKRNLRLFFMCGVSTVFWGIVFSSYFGDLVNVASGTFLGREIGIPPLWFAPMDKPMLMLLFCMGFGILHLTAGYLLKARHHLARKRPLDALYDAFLPLFVMYPMAAVFMGSEMFGEMSGFRLSAPGWLNRALNWITLISMAGILLTAGRDSKGAARFANGVWALYNTVAGWLGDTLSYSRLLALGLATGVIASVMNQLGSMGGGGILGFIMFILVFAVGQSINFGINALGSYVHTNRLSYVEFFGKFYEGGGRGFKPFGVHTKHIKIKEVTIHG